jgi:monoterpene epsilon-lactone hydrolase
MPASHFAWRILLSRRLSAFNLVLKISSALGLGKLHQSESLVEGFRKHGRRMDAVVGFFGSHYRHPFSPTDSALWSWVGDEKSAKRHILYLHGSGFCADLPKTFRYWADRMATSNDAAVLLVDYPLAPESPYPAALDVCLDAYRWMIEDRDLSPANIIIGGDSAGGNLAIATLLRIRQAKLPMPACAFALSPSLDLTLSGASHTENKRTDFFGNLELMQRLAQLYAPRGNYTDGTVSPLFGDYRGFPPIHLQVGAGELLRDDSVRFAEKFKDETPVELVVWDGTPHCHQLFGFLPEAAPARDKLQSFIESHCQ